MEAASKESNTIALQGKFSDMFEDNELIFIVPGIMKMMRYFWTRG